MDTNELFTERVNVRITPTIKTKLRIKTKELGLPEREVVRMILAEALREVKPDFSKLLS